MVDVKDPQAAHHCFEASSGELCDVVRMFFSVTVYDVHSNKLTLANAARIFTSLTCLRSRGRERAKLRQLQNFEGDYKLTV